MSIPRPNRNPCTEFKVHVAVDAIPNEQGIADSAAHDEALASHFTECACSTGSTVY